MFSNKNTICSVSYFYYTLHMAYTYILGDVNNIINRASIPVEPWLFSIHVP